jgi:hypothetical protein
VIDLLHEKKIEIVSPAFMNQHRVDDKSFIPKIQVQIPSEKQDKSPEDLIFDEAIEAQELEKKREYIKELEKKKETLKKDKGFDQQKRN